MIYEFPEVSAPIRQGDIFFDVPKVDLSLEQLVRLSGDDLENTSWANASAAGGKVEVVVPVLSVCAIVITQDCDCLTSPDITLCAIRPFVEVHKLAKDTKAPKKWVGVITQHARMNLKWFYLPPDAKLPFGDRMGVDFLQTIRLPRDELERHRSHRKGRLNPIADEHFRERLSEFYRRYPYDEWYPLNREELKCYQEDKPGTEPFPWQREG